MIDSHLVGENGTAGRELGIQVKLGHEISFLTSTLLHGVKGSLKALLQRYMVESIREKLIMVIQLGMEFLSVHFAEISTKTFVS